MLWTYQEKELIGMDSMRESWKSVLLACLDDDDDMYVSVLVYIQSTQLLPTQRHKHTYMYIFSVTKTICLMFVIR